MGNSFNNLHDVELFWARASEQSYVEPVPDVQARLDDKRLAVYAERLKQSPLMKRLWIPGDAPEAVPEQVTIVTDGQAITVPSEELWQFPSDAMNYRAVGEQFTEGEIVQ